MASIFCEILFYWDYLNIVFFLKKKERYLSMLKKICIPVLDQLDHAWINTWIIIVQWYMVGE